MEGEAYDTGPDYIVLKDKLVGLGKKAVVETDRPREKKRAKPAVRGASSRYRSHLK